MQVFAKNNGSSEEFLEVIDLRSIHFNLHQITVLPVNALQLSTATYHDPTLSYAMRHTQTGWPATGVPAELKAFENHQSELTGGGLLHLKS